MVTLLNRCLAQLALTVLLGVGAGTVMATDHVLIMAISEYPQQPLPGVKHDVANALKLAARLGYSTDGAVVLKDRQLTGAGMRDAFAKLLGRVQQNDRVFFYFSGHGYSIAQGANCVQGLVAQDVSLISTAELSNQLDGIKTKVSDALVIFDACHSGGNREIAATRGFPGGAAAVPARFSAKVWTPKGGERCETITNELAKSWQPPDNLNLTRSVVVPKNNFTFIAAADEREVALDDEEKGGLASLGLLQCATDGVPGAGGLVTAQDLAACAQKHVDRGVQGINATLSRQAFLPHQLAVYGNSSKIFDLKQLPADKQVPPAAVGGMAGAVAGAPSASAVADNAGAVLAGLAKFAANSNGNWGLGVAPTLPAVTVGQPVRVKYQTTQTGYVQLVYVGSDRKDIKRVWPAEGQTRMLATTDGELPISLQITAPAGDNTFLMVLSQTPLNLSGILQGGSASATAGTMQQLGCGLMKQRNAVVKEDSPQGGTCQANPSAKAEVAPAHPEGAGGYTARLFVVRGL